MNLQQAVYMPQLKFKGGELRAIGTARGGRKGRMLPLFIVPPSGAFDHADGRTLGTAEYIRSFGAKIAAHWNGGVVFVDGGHIDDDKHSAAVGQHALTELLERARLAHVFACPVTSLGRSAAYQKAVRRFKHQNEGWPICVKISLSEIDILANPERLNSFLAQFNSPRRETVLLIDAGPIYVPDAQQLAGLVVDALAPLGGQPFAKIFFGSTTFPEKQNLKAGQTGRWRRGDWDLYEAVISRAAELPITPMFSDYALEYPAYYKPVKASPVAHLRYSTADSYIVMKGTTTKKPYGYKAIFPVADVLTESPEFKGSAFSLGNAYIANIAALKKNTGHAGLWRWASTDHHLTLVMQALGHLHGFVLDDEVEEVSAEQFALI